MAVTLLFLHDAVHAFADRLYHGYEVLSAAPFRVTRNSNLIWKKKNRAVFLIPLIISFTGAAKARPFEWRLKWERIARSSIACRRISGSIHGRCFTSMALPTFRGYFTCTTRRRVRI